jgi:hypothetical protein
LVSDSEHNNVFAGQKIVVRWFEREKAIITKPVHTPHAPHFLLDLHLVGSYHTSFERQGLVRENFSLIPHPAAFGRDDAAFALSRRLRLAWYRR